MPPIANLTQQTAMMDLFCVTWQMGYNQITIAETAPEERHHHEGSL
jgi:hypothetical protein